MRLKDAAVRNTKPGAQPKKLSDGGGLHVLIQPTGGKLWRLAYRFSGKQKTLALGAYPAISLEEARGLRDTGSQRVRRVRERKRKDIIFLGIEILPSERNALIRIGLLNRADRNGKSAVRDALYAYFEKYLDPETPPPTELNR